MKLKLDDPILLHSTSSTQFMVAEYIEVHPEIANIQMSYHGKVYDYSYFDVTKCYEGEWLYDLDINLELKKEDE